MRRFIFLAFLLAAAVLQAKIIEVKSFCEIVKYTSTDTLFLLDIDDTILVPEQMLGSDEWFNLRWKKHEASGLSRGVALEKAIAEWESIRHVTKMKKVEQEIDNVIHALQRKGNKVMGLTTQGLALATRTVQQLQEHQIDLSATSSSKEDVFIDMKGHGILYRKGILFTSGQNKGESLFLLCDTKGLKPKRIVYIDDKRSNLTAVEAEAEKRGVEFMGLRYAHADIHKKAFCPEIAEFQFAHSSFARLLSDEEAKLRMKMIASEENGSRATEVEH
jgi:hypothetical protein